MSDNDNVNVPKPKRKRIPLAKSSQDHSVEDPMEYKPNKCSVKARRIDNVQFNVTFDLWFDKHYHDRHQFGDDDGNKRDGIDPHIVENLVRRASQYLLLCGSIVKGFSFINYNQPSAVYVVIKEITAESTLNVAIQTEYISPLTYELTVKTARLGDDFKIAAGQYVLVFQEGAVDLSKFDNGKFVTACSF